MSSIDKLFKDKLGEHSIPIPDGIWDKIDQEINPIAESNRKAILFWFLAGLVLLLILSLGFYQWNKGFNQSSISSLVAEEQTEDLDAISSHEKSVTASAIAVDKIEEHNSSIGNENLALIENQKATKKNVQLESKVKKVNEKLFTPIKTPSPSINEFSKTINEVFTETNINTIRSINTNSSTLVKNLRSDVADFSKISSAYELNSLTLDERKLNVAYFKYDGHNQCEDQLVFKDGLFGEIYASADYGFRKLLQRESAFSDYRRMRESSEVALPSFSVGASLQYVSKMGITLKTGLNYSQINELYRYTDPESGREYTEIIKQDGVVIDSFTYYVPGEERVRVQNRYKLLDIPLIVGFENWRSNKFSYTVNAGIFVNLAFRQRGQFLEPGTLDDVWFTSNQEAATQAFKTRLGISYYTGMGAIFHWSEKTDLFAEANMRFYPESFSRDDYVLIQKYTVLGLKTGLRYKF